MPSFETKKQGTTHAQDMKKVLDQTINWFEDDQMVSKPGKRRCAQMEKTQLVGVRMANEKRARRDPGQRDTFSLVKMTNNQEAVKKAMLMKTHFTKGDNGKDIEGTLMPLSEIRKQLDPNYMSNMDTAELNM